MTRTCRLLPFHRYETKDDTAEEGQDYVRTTGTAIFAPGETRHEVAVQIVDDEGARDARPLLRDGSASLALCAPPTLTLLPLSPRPPSGCEPDEFFFVSLLPRTLTVKGTSCDIGPHQTTRVAIIDDDEKPGGRSNELKFASTEYTVMENEGARLVRRLRSDTALINF